ncbi:MAG: hypothetical protein K8T10_19430 [Candidatus Eremiobacteraeota bacterium]|nr:hypothetical protein [Candidatus Eremiobacteraeota bacterium]
MEFIKKESGETALRVLERAIKRFGHPISTDKPRTYAKNPPKATEKYWVGVCPKCHMTMHVAYFTQIGIRYMCKGCGNKEGSF